MSQNPAVGDLPPFLNPLFRFKEGLGGGDLHPPLFKFFLTAPAPHSSSVKGEEGAPAPQSSLTEREEGAPPHPSTIA